MAEIKLSTKDKVVNFDKTDESGKKIGTEEMALREIEIAMMKNLFSISFSIEKDLKRSILARDLYEQFDNIVDEEKIDMEKTDLDLFGKAWEATEKQRPLAWMKCKDLLKQLI
jgi:hypothetical protein